MIYGCVKCRKPAMIISISNDFTRKELIYLDGHDDCCPVYTFLISIIK